MSSQMRYGRWLVAVAAVCLLAALAMACADDGERQPPTAVPVVTATVVATAQPSPTAAESAQPSPAVEPTITLAAVGDVMLGRSVGERLLPEP